MTGTAPEGDDRFDAVVLAGGRASRLGGVPKPTVVVDGATLLDHALAAAGDAVRTVVVGPEPDRPSGTREVLRTREDPPFGGPVAGLDAGLRALARDARPGPPAPWVLVLAVDVPRARDAVPRLRRAIAQDAARDGAHLVRAGRAQWLVGLYRHEALRDALDALDALAGPDGLHGEPVRRLVSRLACAEVDDPDGVSADVDTWDDVRRLTVGDHDDVTPRDTKSLGRNL